MEIGETITPKSTVDWRNWLQVNHATEKEIWVIFFKKSSGKQVITLREATDESICFGWIDSYEKGIDVERFALRFTPRKPKSSWSKVNIERANKLIKEGKMTQAGFDKLKIKEL